MVVRVRTRLLKAARILSFAALGLTTLWAVSALFFDFSTTSAVLFLAWVLAVLAVTRINRKGFFVWIASLLAVMLWWFSLKPSADRPWQPDVSRLASAEIHGTRATLSNVRNFDYQSEKSFTPRWETRTVDIDTIRGVDLFVSYWGSPWIAHAIVSFALTDGTYLSMSIEARKSIGQEYSAIRGFYRQYQIIYMAAEERDIVRVRTNFRGEDVYLYRTLTTPADAQVLFRQYLAWINGALAQPQWYNALTNNCVSQVIAYLARNKVGGISIWDWRTVLNGPGDRMLYDLGDLAGGLPFPELKQRALINEAAKQASPNDFSTAIRHNRPGF
jgi:Domain of unknown function (DUF4105)